MKLKNLVKSPLKGNKHLIYVLLFRRVGDTQRDQHEPAFAVLAEALGLIPATDFHSFGISNRRL